MATIAPHRAQLTIPAEYLEDARSGIIREIKRDVGALTSGQATLLEHPSEGNREDRDAGAEFLRRDLRVLSALIAAEGDVELSAEDDSKSAPLVLMLEGMVVVLNRRLCDVAQYGPMPMGDVLEIARRLRWAAEQAIRLDAVDWQRAA